MKLFARVKWIALLALSAVLVAPSARTPAQAQAAAAVAPASCSLTWVGHETEIEEFLQTAKVAKLEVVPVGVTKPQRAVFEAGGLVARAAWKPLAPSYRSGYHESYKAEIAAYKLDRFLEMHMVPPIVERRIDRTAGAMVYWIENTHQWDIKKPPSGPGLEWARRVSRMRMFDQLIANIDRNAGNLLYDDDWHLFLIDHSRAFIERKELAGTTAPNRVERGVLELGSRRSISRSCRACSASGSHRARWPRCWRDATRCEWPSRRWSPSAARRMSFSRAAVLLLVLAAPTAFAQGERRIVAIGDVHGAYDEFVTILTRSGLIDAGQDWIGGRTTLVQTGDYTDRGAKVREVLDLLMAIEQKARSRGGQVTTLLGNHEVLNIIGDLRYVTPEICKAFVDAQSEARREAEWRDFEALAAARAKARATVPGVYRQTRDEWMASHPPGWLEYRDALGTRGRDGRWLRSKSIAASVDGTIFMHAGINPDQPATVDEVNTRARAEMVRYDTYLQRLVDRKMALKSFTLPEVLAVSSAELEAASAVMEDAKAKNTAPDLSGFDVPLLREALEITKIGDWSLLAGEGPLWFRGYANWPEDATTAAKVAGFLDKSGVKRIAVGHTPTMDGRIAQRFGGRVFVIDTGMLTSVYKGRPSALEITGQAINAIYEDGLVPFSTASTRPNAAAR